MERASKVVVIGGGIAGLCAGVYARRCGYETEVLESQTNPGGLATSWRRGDYTFEGCLHWLLGSNPDSAMYSQWQEVFDIGSLSFLQPEEYVRVETESEGLSFYTDIDRLRRELLQHAPQDSAEIDRFTRAVRKLSRVPLPDPTAPWHRKWLSFLPLLPSLLFLRKWSKLTSSEYGKRFKHPLIRAVFGSGATGQMSVLAFLFSLAWMSDHNAGYPIGGSAAVIRRIVDNFLDLGGRLRLGAKVERILVENDTAVGVQLASGERVPADWVISAADRRATIYDLLGGRYTDEMTKKIFDTLIPFPSFLQVSLGIAREFRDQSGFVIRMLDRPIKVDAETELPQVAFRFFRYDPTFAPPGKTAVTCTLPTSNYQFWVDLYEHNPRQYQAEKARIAEAVIATLERSFPGIRDLIEVTDVSTPATVIRHTGNWKGSMEGWLFTPSTGFKPLRNTLPGLRHFLMVGQWVMPGGGLPSGLMTARAALQMICRRDRVPFLPRYETRPQALPAAR